MASDEEVSVIVTKEELVDQHTERDGSPKDKEENKNDDKSGSKSDKCKTPTLEIHRNCSPGNLEKCEKTSPVTPKKGPIKAKLLSGSYSRRSGMADDILREASGSTLTMAMIGCLPDNVQQGIRSFSIRQGQQHVTFSFPFMADIIRRFRPDGYVNEIGIPQQYQLTPALFFDQGIEVIDGYQTFVTMAPSVDRPVMPVVLFTLYQKDTKDGIIQHFDSLIKILLDNKTLITVWKMPLSVVDLDTSTLESIIETCAHTILDIQAENLANTFPGKTKEELLLLIKEKMVIPNLRSYHEHFQCHLKQVVSRLQTVEPERFLSIIDHLRSISCTSVDFQKADMMMRSPTTDPYIKAFWKIWGQEQLACKVFPIAMASRSVHKMGNSLYTLRAPSLDHGIGSGMTHVPIKEGLQSIIKCLKAQDISCITPIDRNEKMKGCNCIVCKGGPHRMLDLDLRHREMYWDRCNPELLQAQSAFYRPQPVMKNRLHSTATPYSDALKAAAVSPNRGFIVSNSGPHEGTSALRTDLTSSSFCEMPAPSFNTLAASSLLLQPLMSQYKFGRAPIYPIVYRPRVLSPNLHTYLHPK